MASFDTAIEASVTALSNNHKLSPHTRMVIEYVTTLKSFTPTSEWHFESVLYDNVKTLDYLLFTGGQVFY